MKIKTDYKWVIRIVLISMTTSMLFTLASAEVLGRAGYILSFAVLLIFVLIGIVFDILGLAVTVAKEAPFHSMASHKGRGATESLKLIKNADKVSSFCCDVVGDISGIVSGGAAALVAARLMRSFNSENVFVQLLIPGLVTGLMIGGKALGKTYAINNCTGIVLKAGRLINLFKKRGH